ncbi:hypothetical protein GUJ93_ZPchr0006g41192 [Zizania palustris]|uniref:FAF domain-containing protein n=1 Tax=Zizania palustris TaxID=103762 RepID=A0A8J5T1A6_ZIZPA|nr:hypothetical protein GUJ93_ZPchr0006g41192 [Zizania palustris]
MLLSVSRSVQGLSCYGGLGLRSLLVDDAAVAAGGGGGGVVTRTIVVLSPRVQETNREGECSGCIDDNGEDEEEDGGDEGCWVSYGRRGQVHRLPPPLPSLRCALRRARTEDGRLVIREVPGARRPEYIRAQRRGGRLTMQLVVRSNFHSLPAAAAHPSSPPPENNKHIAAVQAVTDTSTASAEEGVRGTMHKAAPAPPPPPFRAVGCFEDVVKYHSSIGNTPLHQVRMVH